MGRTDPASPLPQHPAKIGIWAESCLAGLLFRKGLRKSQVVDIRDRKAFCYPQNESLSRSGSSLGEPTL